MKYGKTKGKTGKQNKNIQGKVIAKEV